MAGRGADRVGSGGLLCRGAYSSEVEAKIGGSREPKDTVPERIASELVQRLAIVEVSAMEILRYDE